MNKYVIFIEENMFNVLEASVWDNMLKLYKKPRKVINTARLCSVSGHLIEHLSDYISYHSVQSILEEYWSEGYDV